MQRDSASCREESLETVPESVTSLWIVAAVIRSFFKASEASSACTTSISICPSLRGPLAGADPVPSAIAPPKAITASQPKVFEYTGFNQWHMPFSSLLRNRAAIPPLDAKLDIPSLVYNRPQEKVPLKVQRTQDRGTISPALPTATAPAPASAGRLATRLSAQLLIVRKEHLKDRSRRPRAICRHGSAHAPCPDASG